MEGGSVLKLGFGLVTCQRYPGDPRSDVDLYREALELAEEAERLGFDAYWLSEHHFVDDAYMPSLLPFAAAVGARTQRIEVASGVLLAPLHHPLRLAEDAATVDLVSGGRLLFGLGLGWREEEFEALGIEQRRLGRRLEEIVETLRQAWSDGLVEVGDSQPVAVTPKPARPGGPPIWIGGSAERAVRRAARIADGYLASRIPLDTFAERCGWLCEELDGAGRDASGFGIGISTMCFPWPDAEEGWRLVRDHAHYMLWKYADMAGARARIGPPPPAPPLTPDDERRLRASALVGTPEQVAERVKAYANAAGDSFHFVARAYFPGLDPQVQREVLRVLAEDVAPLLH